MPRPKQEPDPNIPTTVATVGLELHISRLIQSMLLRSARRKTAVAANIQELRLTCPAQPPEYIIYSAPDAKSDQEFRAQIAEIEGWHTVRLINLLDKDRSRNDDLFGSGPSAHAVLSS